VFKGDGLVRPKNMSFLLTLIVAIVAYFGSQLSSYIGYVLAIMAMLVIGFASDSVWPTGNKKENPIVFSLFWGLIVGLLVPFLLARYWGEGIEGVVELLLSSL